MLETKYGLKYSMPHSIVHIVDNSMYQGELPKIVADDPSLYSTIVVSGAPMGADNEIIPINRSDVLNISYGMANLSSGDIKKFGQTITYPSAILAQDAPIKFMRVTPDEATYAFSCLLIQWRWDGATMHVRFKTTSGNGNNGLPPGIVHSSFKNPARLNSTLVRMFAEDFVPDETGGTWKQRVFMTSIAAGRGKVYDFYNYAINQTQQSKRPANIRYLFATIDTRTDQIVERFYASLVNQNNGGRADAIETVNVQVGQRVKGSSIIIPTVNELAVTELYKEYMAKVKEMIDADILPAESDEMKWVTDVYKTMTVNIFDPIYGRYIYNGDTDVKLPYFQVDMFDLDIPQLETANKLNIALGQGEVISEYLADPIDLDAVLDSKTYGVTNPDDAYHVGDLFITNTATRALTLITSINQYTGAITSIPISQVCEDKTATPQKKYMFSAFTSVDSTPTLDNVFEAVNDLIRRRKLVPTIESTETDQQGKSYYKYSPDFVLVENKGSINPNNKLTNFIIAKIGYADKETTSTTDPVPNQEKSYLYNTKARVYSLLVYPSTKITSFATETTDEFYNSPGATYIDTTNGEVYVNGYTSDSASTGHRYPVADSETPFFVGNCPTSFAITNDLMNASYDLLIYKDSNEAGGTNVDVTWSVIGGSGVPNTGRGYKTGDVVTLKDTVIDEETRDIPDNTKFTVSSVISGTDDQTITVRFVSGPAQTGKIVEGVYDTENLTAYDPVGASDEYVAGRFYEKSTDGEGHATYTRLDSDTAPADWGVAEDKYFTERLAQGLKIKITAADIKTIIAPPSANPTVIKRFMITGTQGSLYRYQMDPTDIPSDYYSPSYGINPNSELGGIPIENGYAGFFDDDISEIEFKWRYSALLVKAYKGEIDPRIKSPVRCPAKYLFDGGTNTIVGQTILPYMVYKPVDIINASTIYNDDEKEAILLNSDLIANIKEFEDIDVKQAMYDLAVYRCYQGIPEDKRPIGPGSGLSLHLDSGVTDANTAMLVNQSFTKRFNNPNVSWDIGGYVSSADGISYTFTKALADSMFAHLKRFSVNKPFTGKYTNISPESYISFFPDIDIRDWEERELLYKSGGNAWIMDVNGNLQRKSQRTLYREGDTSDLIQENNMRTLSQLTYLLQNKIDSYLLEYNDDGVLKTLKDDVDSMFSNWVGNLVQKLDITFERDINPLDGGEIVVCYCNVTFRGLILRVPIIVNVQRRTDSE
jgi:hypothetical protein